MTSDTLSSDDIDWLRVRIGSEPDQGTLNEMYARVGSKEAVAREVFVGRLQALRDQPAQFAVPGEYSQNVAENIRALERAIADLDDGIEGAVHVVTVHPPPDPPVR